MKIYLFVFMFFLTINTFAQDSLIYEFENGLKVEVLKKLDDPFDLRKRSFVISFKNFFIEDGFTTGLEMIVFHRFSRSIYFDFSLYRAFFLDDNIYSAQQHNVKWRRHLVISPQIHYEIIGKTVQKKKYNNVYYPSSTSYLVKTPVLKRKSLMFNSGFKFSQNNLQSYFNILQNVTSILTGVSYYETFHYKLKFRNINMANYFKINDSLNVSRENKFSFNLLFGVPVNKYLPGDLSTSDFHFLGCQLSAEQYKGYLSKSNLQFKYGLDIGLEPSYKINNFYTTRFFYASVNVGIVFCEL